MAEVYINTNSPVRHKVFWQGEIVDADSNPTVKVYDITEDPKVSPAIPTSTIQTTLTSSKIETDVGNYQVALPLSLTQRQRRFKLLWEYTVDSSPVSYSTYVDIVVPYTNIYEAIDDLNFGVEPTDPNYKTYAEIQAAETYARKKIEDYTGQEFNLYDDVEVVYGIGTDILTVPYRIHEIHKLYANDILLVDNLATPPVNNWLHVPQISESNYAIRIDRTNLIDNTVYVANGMVAPTINELYVGEAFIRNYRYIIHGRWGWPEVPDRVQLACKELMKDYFAKDSIWRNKYVKSVQTFDWQFEYDSGTYSGTGNKYADDLLAEYIVDQMVVI
jgi:hypothetical protein